MAELGVGIYLGLLVLCVLTVSEQPQVCLFVVFEFPPDIVLWCLLQ